MATARGGLVEAPASIVTQYRAPTPIYAPFCFETVTLISTPEDEFNASQSVCRQLFRRVPCTEIASYLDFQLFSETVNAAVQIPKCVGKSES